MNDKIQIRSSRKSGINSKESYIVTRGWTSYLRILGSQPQYSLVTATASEDSGRITVCNDQVRLIAAAKKLGKELETNTLYVGQGYHHERLYAEKPFATDVHFTSDKPMPQTFKCTAKFRYRQKDTPVTVYLNEDQTEATVVFDAPVRAITPGQAVVFYDGLECLGGGTIDKAFQAETELQYV